VTSGESDGASATRPAATLVDSLIELLTAQSDPLVRWQAIGELSGRLDWLRALTVRQLLLEGRSQRAAAAVLGVSKGRVNQLAGRAPVDDAAYAWGQALAVAGALAALAERPGSTRFLDDHARLVRVGLRTPAVWADLEDVVPAWVAAAHRQGRGPAAETLMQRLAERLSVAVDLPDALTSEQRGEVTLGFHRERAGTIAGTLAAARGPDWPTLLPPLPPDPDG
jgi:hypothetical protein